MSTQTTARTVRLDPRLEGPRGHANGGFACGTFAALVGGTARVRLIRKVPLGVDLDVSRSQEESGVDVSYAGRVLATARPIASFVAEPPVTPSFEEAAAARLAHPLRDRRHLLSGCVVCGPRRLDGLAVTPGPLSADPDVLASPFVPAYDFADEDGRVPDAALWGALDCPSYPAAALRDGELHLLGTLEAHLRRAAGVGERLVAVGWTTGNGDRAIRTASAIIDEQGEVVASAWAVWVRLSHQRVARLAARLGA